MKLSLLPLLFFTILIGCKNNHKEQRKGFQVREILTDENGKKIVGLPIDSLNFLTQPGNILLTFHSNHSLTPIFKVNYDKKKRPFTGSNAFHGYWSRYESQGNKWHHNFLPGLKAMYGYNLVNIAHFNYATQQSHTLFANPVLIKTFYYPANTKDTLNFNPVKRDYYLVSVYDEDTDKDGYINSFDLRRFYLFDINGKNKKAIIPTTHSVLKSEYDPANDYMLIYTRLDKNNNGRMESEEPMYLFWVDLNNPNNTGIQYQSK